MHRAQDGQTEAPARICTRFERENCMRCYKQYK
jgi:hypothetical protein